MFIVSSLKTIQICRTEPLHQASGKTPRWLVSPKRSYSADHGTCRHHATTGNAPSTRFALQCNTARRKQKTLGFIHLQRAYPSRRTAENFPLLTISLHWGAGKLERGKRGKEEM